MRPVLPTLPWHQEDYRLRYTWLSLRVLGQYYLSPSLPPGCGPLQGREASAGVFSSIRLTAQVRAHLLHEVHKQFPAPKVTISFNLEMKAQPVVCLIYFCQSLLGLSRSGNSFSFVTGQALALRGFSVIWLLNASVSSPWLLVPSVLDQSFHLLNMNSISADFWFLWQASQLTFHCNRHKMCPELQLPFNYSDVTINR